MSEPLTDEELTDMTVLHMPYQSEQGERCSLCYGTWPCLVARLAGQIRRLRGDYESYRLAAEAEAGARLAQVGELMCELTRGQRAALEDARARIAELERENAVARLRAHAAIRPQRGGGVGQEQGK